MLAIRWRFPDAPLRRGVVLASVVGFLTVTGFAAAERGRLHLSALYPPKTAVLFGVMMAIAIGFVSDHHPYSQFGPANYVTTIRVMLVALIASLIGEPAAPLFAMSTAVVVAGLDGFDGWLARRSRMLSDFGARYDMETDAAFVLALSVLAWQYGKAGTWVLLSGLMRYFFVAAAWLLPWMGRPLRPTSRGKTICVIQMIGLIMVISPRVAATVSARVAAGALAALSLSFAIDVMGLWRSRPVAN